MREKSTEQNKHAVNLTKVKANDGRVLEEIYVAHYAAIERYILANNGNHADAKDIYQDAFLAFWRNVQLGRFETHHSNSIGSYLMRIVKNKWIDELRKQKKMKYSVLKYDIEDVAGEVINPEEQEYMDVVKVYYQKMEEPCKTVLHKFYFEKDSLRHIASYFSWTEATAKNNKYRCLQKLRKAVRETL